MHPLYSQHPTILAAEEQLSAATAAAADLTARSEAAIAKHEQEKREALDVGEVWAPVREPVPSREVRERAARSIDTAKDALQRAEASIAVDLCRQLEAREAELLERTRTTPVGKLAPLVAEVDTLLKTKSHVAAVHRKVQQREAVGGPSGRRVVRLETALAGPVATADLVAAALAGSSLLGSTPEEVEAPAPSTNTTHVDGVTFTEAVRT